MTCWTQRPDQCSGCAYCNPARSDLPADEGAEYPRTPEDALTRFPTPAEAMARATGQMRDAS